MYSKQPSWTHGFNAKIGLKNDPVWAEIFEKNHYWLAVWFGMPCQKIFLWISRPRVVRFSNRFLRWNREIKTVVLSTIKVTNGVKKFMKIFQKSSKIAAKTQNCGKTRPDWAKRIFIQVSVTLNRVESVEISHATANLFYFVPQCNYYSIQLCMRQQSYRTQLRLSKLQSCISFLCEYTFDLKMEI